MKTRTFYFYVRLVQAHGACHSWVSRLSQHEGSSTMQEDTTKRVRELVDAVYRSESRPILATLIRLLGDFDAAEEALHEAFAVAVEQWSRHGVPAKPRAWLISTGRFKAIDSMRRRARYSPSDWNPAPVTPRHGTTRVSKTTNCG